MSDSVGEGLPGMRPGLMDRLARPFVVLNERYAPDPFVFVVVLALVALVPAVSETET